MLILAQVHRVEGTINQFTGDGVMALFGAPLALEDAPRRALMAALGMQRDLQALDREVQEQYGRSFQMRIGIHSGPVVVGTIGDDLRMDYTAVGDTTNLAARLEGLAAPGKIVISESTARQVEGFFDLEALPPASLKGQPGLTQAFEVLEALAVEHRVDAASASAEGLTTFQGRELELDLLDGAFEQAKSGRGQVAFIVGEAGLGKSRLVHEFRRRLEERNEACTWVEGGVEAVVDKDLASALLATELGAEVLLLLTDQTAVFADWPEPACTPIRSASIEELQTHSFEEGTMGPKVEAACRFAAATGKSAAIGALGDAAAIVEGKAGTRVEGRDPMG